MTLTPLGRVTASIAVGIVVGFTLGVVVAVASSGRIHANIAINVVFGTFALALAVVALRTAWIDEREHRRRASTHRTVAKLQRDRGGVR